MAAKELTPARPKRSALYAKSGSNAKIAEEGEGDGDSDTTERTDFEEVLVKSLRRLGLKAPKPFNPKREKHFEILLVSIEHHFKVANIPDEPKTSSLVLLLDLDGYETARHLDIMDESPFEEVKRKLKDYFAVTETKEELLERLNLRVQEYT